MEQENDALFLLSPSPPRTDGGAGLDSQEARSKAVVAIHELRSKAAGTLGGNSVRAVCGHATLRTA